MRRNFTLYLILGLFLLPVTASAVDILGESRTYVQARETADDETLLPLYEYLDFSLGSVNHSNLSFHFGGWVRQDLTNDQSFDDRSFNGDLQYAYLGLRKETGNSGLNLGRVLVYEGVASEQVDGISASTDLRGGFGMSVYGGVPVESDFDDRDGDSIYGGRLSHTVSNLYTLGFSYLKERNDSSSFRSEAGVDVSLRPFDMLEIFGRSSYNGETFGWMEHAYYLTLNPFEKLRLSSEVTSTNYQDYFQAVDLQTTSAFSIILPGTIDPKEKLLLIGGEAEYTIADGLAIAAGYKNYDYSLAESADYYGGRLTYSKPDSWGAGLWLYRMDGQTDLLAYNESRVYGYKEFGKADLTVDFLNVAYDQEINDVKNAYAASIALGYALTDKARIAADIDYSRNPAFDTDIRGFIKFLYGYGIDGRFKI